MTVDFTHANIHAMVGGEGVSFGRTLGYSDASRLDLRSTVVVMGSLTVGPSM